MSRDGDASDESVIGREEYEAERQDSANERAIISASVEDLKADMAARFEEVLAAVHARSDGSAAGGAAGVAPAPMYGGAGAHSSSSAYGPHPVGPRPELQPDVGWGGGGSSLSFTPATASRWAAGGSPMGPGTYGGGAGVWHDPRRMEKVIMDQRVTAWSLSHTRMWWVVMGFFPPKIEKQSLQGLMYDGVEVTAAVADMLLFFRGFDVVAFTPRGAGGGRLPIATHLSLMAGAFITIARRGIADDARAAAASRARVDGIDHAFKMVIGAVERHARENYAAIQEQHNRDIILTFLGKDMESYVRDVQLFSDEMQRRHVLPPPSEALPAAPLPAFPKFTAYLRSGGLINSMVQGKSGRSPAAAAGAAGAGSPTKQQGTCYQFTRKGFCRYGEKCKFQHVAKRKAGREGGKGGGDPGGHADDGDSHDTKAEYGALPLPHESLAPSRFNASGGRTEMLDRQWLSRPMRNVRRGFLVLCEGNLHNSTRSMLHGDWWSPRNLPFYRRMLHLSSRPGSARMW